ncbi:MAG: peptide chain release factor N(5)-glutamine methyltransferase [Bryobacterales bacterium]|nr:peptide chain release factor N(5)-glutamine methyltransferase [Bryobacteraceae bacterium]MDW8130533.1 peptide chain release factor N(5)-glutamine methyltransferase [Bryobacterales bacterium]
MEAPRLTAEVLLAALLERPRAYLYAHPEESLPAGTLARYEAMVAERAAGKPVQYITGWQEFYGRRFLVTPDVLIPRPETEHLVEAALAVARDAADVADVGCGSGAIAVTLSLEIGRTVWATDVSLAALAVAARNALRHGARVELVACDLVSAFAPASLDLLVSNPPYVAEEEYASLPREVREYEPRLALLAGRDGLDVYRRLTGEARRVLRPGGWLVLELGWKALEPVRAMLKDGWDEHRVWPDLAGHPRVLAARRARKLP